MKAKILLVILLAISLNCFSQQQITKIEILSVPASTAFSKTVDCTDFESIFQNVIERKSIFSSSTIYEIMSIIKELPEVDASKYPTPDTRMKLRLYSDERFLNEICIGKFTILKGGKLYFYSNEMLELIDYLEKYKQPILQNESQQEEQVDFNVEKQYKGFLGAAMGTISFDNSNHFFYNIKGSILNEKILGTFEIDNDIIKCTVDKSHNNLFDKGEILKFMLKSDTLFQFNSEQEPDMSRPLLRVK